MKLRLKQIQEFAFICKRLKIPIESDYHRTLLNFMLEHKDIKSSFSISFFYNALEKNSSALAQDKKDLLDQFMLCGIIDKRKLFPKDAFFQKTFESQVSDPVAAPAPEIPLDHKTPPLGAYMELG